MSLNCEASWLQAESLSLVLNPLSLLSRCHSGPLVHDSGDDVEAVADAGGGGDGGGCGLQDHRGIPGGGRPVHHLL